MTLMLLQIWPLLWLHSPSNKEQRKWSEMIISDDHTFSRYQKNKTNNDDAFNRYQKNETEQMKEYY